MNDEKKTELRRHLKAATGVLNNFNNCLSEIFMVFIVETPIPKANNLKVTIGVAELVSCNETR